MLIFSFFPRSRSVGVAPTHSAAKFQGKRDKWRSFQKYTFRLKSTYENLDTKVKKLH